MIAVLVAAYQGKKYLEEQLDSILNQTVMDIQVLISDGGSTDGTRELARQHAAKFPERVHCMRHSWVGEVSGLESSDAESPAAEKLNPAAANPFWLLSWAEGDYIMLSDQDDVWREDKAEWMMFHMRKTEKKWGADTPILLFSDAKVVDRELQEITPSFLKYQHINPSRMSLNEILVKNPVTGGAVMSNATPLSYVSKASRQRMMYDWWIALAASCFGHVRCVKEPLYSYRQHGSNTLGAKRIGSPEDMRERMKRGEQVREQYERMFIQASCFSEQFGRQLTKQQGEALRAYLSLPCQRLRGRMKTVRRYYFYRSSRIQTAVMCFTIPRRQERRPGNTCQSGTSRRQK